MPWTSKGELQRGRWGEKDRLTVVSLTLTGKRDAEKVLRQKDSAAPAEVPQMRLLYSSHDVEKRRNDENHQKKRQMDCVTRKRRRKADAGRKQNTQRDHGAKKIIAKRDK